MSAHTPGPWSAKPICIDSGWVDIASESRYCIGCATPRRNGTPSERSGRAGAVLSRPRTQERGEPAFAGSPRNRVVSEDAERQSFGPAAMTSGAQPSSNFLKFSTKRAASER